MNFKKAIPSFLLLFLFPSFSFLPNLPIMSDEEPESSGCELMGQFGILLQLGLAVLSFSTLMCKIIGFLSFQLKSATQLELLLVLFLVKRWREKPRRPWKIW